MEPLKVLVALAWGVLLGAAGLSLADMLFPQSVSISPATSMPAEPEWQGLISLEPQNASVPERSSWRIAW